MPAPHLGVFLPSMNPPRRGPGDMAAVARHAEALGFESVRRDGRGPGPGDTVDHHRDDGRALG